VSHTRPGLANRRLGETSDAECAGFLAAHRTPIDTKERGDGMPFAVTVMGIERPSARAGRMNRWNRGRSILILLASAVTLSAAGRAEGQTESPRALLTAATRAAIERSLERLAEVQLRNGAFGRDLRDPHPHPGVTALAGMAFLASGSTPVRGPYREAVNRVTDYLIASCDEHTGVIADTMTRGEPMYSHAFAALYLAEVTGEDPRAKVRAAVKRATQLILRAQRPNGGWRYRIDGRDADVSVTACAVMALKGARLAGIHVPAPAIRSAVKYILACAGPDGAFRYQAEGGHATFQLTAAAVCSLFAVGIQGGREIEEGLRYLERFRVDRGRPVIGHFFYGHYYAIQAAYQVRGEYFRAWYRPLRDKLLREQEKDGRWRRSTVGDVYATAMGALILAIPYHHLPIFVR